jgi:hypothetical protein
MNAGTCWGKNIIGPRGRGVERPRKATLPLPLHHTQQTQLKNIHAFSEIRTRNPSNRTVFQRTPTGRGSQHFTCLYGGLAVQFPLELEMWICCEHKESLRAVYRKVHI